MSVRADPRNGVVVVDSILDAAAAEAIRDAVLQMNGDVLIDLHEVRVVHDSAVFYLVTSLRLADRAFTIQGLSWPHANLLGYFGAAGAAR